MDEPVRMNANCFLKDAVEAEFTAEEWVAWAKMKGLTPYQLYLRDQFEKMPAHTTVM